MTKTDFLIVIAVFLFTISIPSLFADNSSADGDPVARIGNVYYTTLNDALEQSSNGDIVIVFDGCRLSSDATVPSGVTLLLPYSDGHGDVDPDGFEHGPDPTINGDYRKKATDKLCVTHLYVDNSTRLTVYGDIIIGGILSEKFTFDYQGHTYGEHGRIVLDGNLILKNGSHLKCYGYVVGNGKVIAESGSEVYEPFIIADYVGADRVRDLYNAEQSPFDRYSFNNIESILELNYGARLIGLLNVYADGSIRTSELDIVGIKDSHINSLMELVPGSRITIEYDANKYVKSDWNSNIWNDLGKTTITIDGGASFNIFKVIYDEQYFDMTNIPFSVPYNFSYTLKNGLYEMNANLRVLPGASVTISENAKLVVNSTLLVFDGLEDYPYRDKYYPGPELLEQYGFATHGSLLVNGGLQITKNSAVLGILESEGGNPVITMDSSVKAYKNWSVNYGTKDSLTIRTLSLWVFSDNSLYVLQPGCQYPLSPGTIQTQGFTYLRNGASITKSIVQTYKGTYIAPSQQPTVSMTISLNNTTITDVDIFLEGTYAIHLTKEGGRYVTYSANDGDYTVTAVVSGRNIQAGEITIKGGRCVTDVNLFTVSFVSDSVVIGDEIVMYDSTIALPIPRKEGHTFNGWYDDNVIFTSKTKVVHEIMLNALWGEDTDEHRNITSDKLPMTISEDTKDVRIFFDEGAVKLFIDVIKYDAGSLNMFYVRTNDEYSFMIESDCVEKDVLKTITIPCDIIRPGLHVICNDGYEVTDVVIDNASQTVTFSSMGSSFKLIYDPDPKPFGQDLLLPIIFIVALAIIIATIALTAIIAMKKKK